VHPDDFDIISDVVNDFKNEKIFKDVLFRIVNVNNEIRYINLCSNPVYINNLGLFLNIKMK